MNEQKRQFLPIVQEVIDEFIPICQKLAAGRGEYAISVGGSLGKGTWDKRSDIDFRLYHEFEIPWSDTHPELWEGMYAATEHWRKQGVIVDGIWARQIAPIDAAIRRWMEGKIEPQDMVWTIWGYHLLTDIHNQYVIEDRFGVINAWKALLKTYPAALKSAIIEKHLGSLRYWRTDYHYANKVQRQDVVFLAGLSAHLIHDLMQVLFAINEVFFVGDGNNLGYTQSFAIKPQNLELRVQTVLYPRLSPDRPFADMINVQYHELIALIDDVIALVEIH
jgi:hypothetical protein